VRGAEVKIDLERVSDTSPEIPALTARRRGKPTSTISSGSDGFTLPSRAEESRRVRPRLDDLRESRQERIAHIRARVREDAYRVWGEHIAEAMLRDETIVDLLGLRIEK
jgi:hypothetical protein